VQPWAAPTPAAAPPTTRTLAIDGTRTRGAWTYHGGAMYFTGFAAAPDGRSIWASTNRGLVRFEPGADRIRRWTTLDGLADTDTHGVAVDRRGTVWVATFSGVSAFDGRTFTNFGERDLGFFWTSRVALDTRGRVWVGSQGRAPRGAACRVDGRRWARYSTADDDEAFPQQIDAIAPDPKGGVWIAGSAGVLPPGSAGYFRRTDVQVVFVDGLGAVFPQAPLPAAAAPDTLVQGLVLDAGGRPVLATSSGLYRLEGDAWRDLGAAAGLPGGEIWQVARDPAGPLWVASSAGLGVLLGERFQVRAPLPPGWKSGERPGHVELALVGGGRILLASLARPGFDLRAGEGWIHYQAEQDGPPSLPGYSVWDIAADPQGRVHLVGNTVGHVVFDGRTWQQLGDPAADYRLGRDRAGRYAGWVGGGQLCDARGRVQSLKALGLSELPGGMFVDSRGHTWLWGWKLEEWDGARVVDHSADDPRLARARLRPGGYGGLNLRGVGEDSRGRIYVQASWGLFGQKGPRRWEFLGGKLEGMHGLFGWHSRFDGNRDEALFAGSWGVSIYSIRSGRWRNYVDRSQPVPGEEAGLAGSYIENIGFDARGQAWFASYEGGASSFDGQTWRYLTAADGLASNSVWGIGHDGDGALWFGTQGGVSVLSFLAPKASECRGSVQSSLAPKASECLGSAESTLPR
jgi:hypothetical protein